MLIMISALFYFKVDKSTSKKNTMVRPLAVHSEQDKSYK